MITEIDLAEFAGKDVYVKLRNGTQTITVLRSNDSIQYPYRIDRHSCTETGRYIGPLNADPFDIIEIRLASEVTILKWITDRRPTKADRLNGRIQELHAGRVMDMAWGSGAPWTHCPDLQPPQPAPEPPAEMQQLRQQLTAIQARLDEMETGE